jgi:hypothetical protein
VNILGRAAQVYVPESLRKALLNKVFEDTAAAFGRPQSPPRGLSAERLLNAFAEFTADAAAGPMLPGVSQRLFEVTYRYGKTLRRLFGIASTRDVMAAARAVYRAIGIDFRGRTCGEITIRRCAFSYLYRPEVCQVMSALDTGFLAGLSDGGRLVFSRRITEGYPCCLARLTESHP